MPAAPKCHDWSWDAYLEWEASQPLRHELVDGEVRARGGGTAAHDTIANNLRAELRDRLRGTDCRPHGPDLKVRAGRDGRYPDALIDRGPRIPDALVASEPVAVFEVLSRTTHLIDATLKLRDYEAAPSIRHYVLISQTEPRALVYRRDPAGALSARNATLLRGMDAAIDIAGLGVSIPFAALYEGVAFAPDDLTPA